MIGGLISFVIFIIILAILFWVIREALSIFGFGSPQIMRLIGLVFVLILLGYVLNLFGIMGSPHYIYSPGLTR